MAIKEWQTAIATKNNKGKWSKTLREPADLRSAALLPQKTEQK
jgi:hypothetical protein